MKWFWRIVGIGVLALAGWWGWQRIFVTEEQRIHRRLSAMARAVEQGGFLMLEDKIAQDYHDDFGLDKAGLLGVVRTFRAQYDAVLIILTDVTIEVTADGQKAQAVFIAKVLAKAKGATSESEVRADRYRVHFRKINGDWKMTRAESPELKFE